MFITEEHIRHVKGQGYTARVTSFENVVFSNSAAGNDILHSTHKKRRGELDPASVHTTYDVVDSSLSNGLNFFEDSLDKGKLRCICGCNDGKESAKGKREKISYRCAHFKSPNHEQLKKLKFYLCVDSPKYRRKFDCKCCEQLPNIAITIHPPNALWYLLAGSLMAKDSINPA